MCEKSEEERAEVTSTRIWDIFPNERKATKAGTIKHKNAHLQNL